MYQNVSFFDILQSCRKSNLNPNQTKGIYFDFFRSHITFWLVPSIRARWSSPWLKVASHTAGARHFYTFSPPPRARPPPTSFSTATVSRFRRARIRSDRSNRIRAAAVCSARRARVSSRRRQVNRTREYRAAGTSFTPSSSRAYRSLPVRLYG